MDRGITDITINGNGARYHSNRTSRFQSFCSSRINRVTIKRYCFSVQKLIIVTSKESTRRRQWYVPYTSFPIIKVNKLTLSVVASITPDLLFELVIIRGLDCDPLSVLDLSLSLSSSLDTDKCRARQRGGRVSLSHVA